MITSNGANRACQTQYNRNKSLQEVLGLCRISRTLMHTLGHNDMVTSPMAPVNVLSHCSTSGHCEDAKHNVHVCMYACMYACGHCTVACTHICASRVMSSKRVCLCLSVCLSVCPSVRPSVSAWELFSGMWCYQMILIRKDMPHSVNANVPYPWSTVSTSRVPAPHYIRRICATTVTMKGTWNFI
jgi:hypothetical protein